MTSLPFRTFAQVSAYFSGGYGHDSNPLRNYGQIADHVREGYLDLGYWSSAGRSSVNLEYTGGLMLFDRLQERNYYEHTLGATYSFHVFTQREDTSHVIAAQQDSTDSTATAPPAAVDQSAQDDSSGSFLSLSARAGARHDRAVYADYDNYGGDVALGYRLDLGSGMFLRVSNDAGVREYQRIDELSNTVDALNIRLGRAAPFTYGVTLGGGYKRYTSSLYDTSMFETRRTFISEASGKGKGGAILHIPSTKRILVNPESDRTYQVSASVDAGMKLKDASWSMNFTYRRNPGPPNRYLLQYANPTLLNEDIYNDFMSYEGPGATLDTDFPLLLGMRCNLSVNAERRRFGAPALNLLGEEIAPTRRDLHTAAIIAFSRFTPVSGGVGMDLTLTVTAIRNQSNDDYNDFSVSGVEFSLGLGY